MTSRIIAVPMCRLDGARGSCAAPRIGGSERELRKGNFSLCVKGFQVLTTLEKWFQSRTENRSCRSASVRGPPAFKPCRDHATSCALSNFTLPKMQTINELWNPWHAALAPLECFDLKARKLPPCDLNDCTLIFPEGRIASWRALKHNSQHSQGCCSIDTAIINAGFSTPGAPD